VIWTNLAYNSTLVKWYVLYVPAGETYEKQELVDLADTVSPQAQSSRKSENAVSSLAETMRHSPIGNTLEMGIPMPSGGSFRFHKKGWETPDAASLLYAFYRYAEKMNGHYDLTLSELDSVRKKRPERFVGIEPVSLFGLNEGKFRDIVLSLAVHYPEFIRVSFDADLDNIRLFSERSSLDVVDLVLNGGSSW
jgi:phosphoadenosine phosphosulfate reductase